MRQISIEKVTLNIGAGKDQAKLEKGIKLINNIAGTKPVKTFTKKRIQEWGLRPGLPIGCKLTLRKEKALELLKRLLEAKDNTLKASNLDNEGNISFGIGECAEYVKEMANIVNNVKQKAFEEVIILFALN